MPLNKSKSKAAFSSNVSELMHSGRPQNQALAIAYRVQRGKKRGGRAYADGGVTDPILMPPTTGMTNRYVDPHNPFTQAASDIVNRYADYYKTPGAILKGEYNVTPQTPGQWSEWDQENVGQAAKKQQYNGTVMALDAMTGGMPFAQQGTVGSFGGKLFHGSPNTGLSELTPSTRGPLGQGVYTSPFEGIAKHYAGSEGRVYELPGETMDVHHGHGHRTDAEWHGFKSDQQRLIDAASPSERPAVEAIVKRMWSGDGYPQFSRLSKELGSQEAAQELYKRAGFKGVSGQIDGPEVLLFEGQPMTKRQRGGRTYDDGGSVDNRDLGLWDGGSSVDNRDVGLWDSGSADNNRDFGLWLLKNRMNEQIAEQDALEATRRAYQSGDYDARGNYNPFEPRRMGYDDGGVVDALSQVSPRAANIYRNVTSEFDDKPTTPTDIYGHLLDYQRQQQAKVGQAAGRMPGLMAQGVLDVPRRAFEESENLRTTGEYDPEPVVSAATMAMTGGIPFAPRGAVGAFGGKLPPGKAIPTAANKNALPIENLTAKIQRAIADNPDLAAIAQERPAAFNDLVVKRLNDAKARSDQSLKEAEFQLGPNPTREEFEKWALRPYGDSQPKPMTTLQNAATEANQLPKAANENVYALKPGVKRAEDLLDEKFMADFHDLLSGASPKPRTELEAARQGKTKTQEGQQHKETMARLENRLGPVLNMTEAQAKSLDPAALQALHKQVQEYELAMIQLRPMIPELLRNGLTMPQIVKMDPSQAYRFVKENRTGSGRVNRESDKEIGNITNSLNSVRRWVSDRLHLLEGRHASGGMVYPSPYASGGMTHPPWYARAEARALEHSGFIHSPVAGRTDKIPMSVKSGSYVVPADVVSGLGQGNSVAGAHGLAKMFGMGPYNSGPIPHLASGPKSAKIIRQRFADGGVPSAPPTGEPTDIIAAGGEFVVPHDKIAEKFGEVGRGHEIMDRMIHHIRRKTIKTMRALPGPKGGARHARGGKVTKASGGGVNDDEDGGAGSPFDRQPTATDIYGHMLDYERGQQGKEASRVARGVAGTLGGLAGGFRDWVKTPVDYLHGVTQGPEIPGYWSEMDQEHRNQATEGAKEWGASTALGMVGTPGAPQGALGSGAKRGHWFDRRPEDEYVYHGTDTSHLEGIKKEGLQAFLRNYFATDPKVAMQYGYRPNLHHSSEQSKRPGVLLRVPKSVVDLEAYQKGQRKFDDFWTGPSEIGPEHIEMRHQGAWNKLK